MKRNTIYALALLGLVTAGIYGCSGDTQGGSYPGQSGEGGSFAANESSVGTIRVALNTSEIPVSATAGFRAFVTNSLGQPATNASVVCDTERGLALIEPSTGRELTDSSGQFSGRVGCEAPGSFRIGCRLGSGVRRHLVSINCTGAIPAGFGGFPGAGGRGLGAGGGVGNDGDPDGNTAGSIRIVRLVFSEAGQSDTVEIDTLRRRDCNPEEPDTITPEPFSDTAVAIHIRNDSARTYTFNSFEFSMPDTTSAGGTFRSNRLSLTGASFDALPNGAVTIYTANVFAQVGVPNSVQGIEIVGEDDDTRAEFVYITAKGPAGTEGGSPVFAETIGNGSRAVTFRVYGTDSNGSQVTLSGSRLLRFANFSRCDD